MQATILKLAMATILGLLLGAPSTTAQQPGPGETSGADLAPLRVTGFDHATGAMTLSYQSGCDATDNNVYFGPMPDVASHGWSGERCGVGTGGQIVDFDPGSESYFFIVAGNEAAIEGSYGVQRDLLGTGSERPAFVGNACGKTQSLFAVCDEIPAGATCTSSLDCGIRQDCVADSAGGADCRCEAPYAGAYCQACAPGYSGPDCRQCAEGYVLASVDLVTGDETSEGFFAGTMRCEPDLPGTCSGRSCSGNGDCTVDGRDAVCVCDEGYTGDDCSECAPDYAMDPFGDCLLGGECREDKCGGHGDCIAVQFGGIACDCDAGYGGLDCGGPDLEITTGADRRTLYDGESIVLEPTGVGPFSWRVLSGPAVIEDCPRDDVACPLGGARLTVTSGTGGPFTELELIQVELSDGPGGQAGMNLAALPSSLLPFTGAIRTELLPFYRAMLKFMRARGIRGGSLAISKGGKLIGSNGYGYRDAGLDGDPFVNAGEGGPLVHPNAPFRLASISKTLTAAAVRDAAADAGINIASTSGLNRMANWVQNATGINLTTGPAVFDYNLTGGNPDANWANISIQHLLNHHAGFYRDITPSPGSASVPSFSGSQLPNTGLLPGAFQNAAWGANSSDVTYATSYILAALQLRLDPRVTVEEVIRFVKGVRLNYAPGGTVQNNRDNYSNLGYILLGRVLEGLRGQTFDPDEPGVPSGWGAYPDLVQDYLCEASGITDGVFPGNAFNPWAGEPYYRDIDWQGNETRAWNLAEGSDKIRYDNLLNRWEFCQSGCGGGGAVWNQNLNTPAAYGGIWLAERNSAGGMVASAPALLQFARNHRIRVGAPNQTTTGIGTLLPSPGNHSWRSSHSGSLRGTRTLLFQLGGNRNNTIPFDWLSWDADPSTPVDLDNNGAVIISEATYVTNCDLPGDVTVAALFNQRQDRRAPSSNVSPQSGNLTASTLYGRIADYLADAACKVDDDGWPAVSEPQAMILAPPVCP